MYFFKQDVGIKPPLSVVFKSHSGGSEGTIPNIEVHLYQFCP